MGIEWGLNAVEMEEWMRERRRGSSEDPPSSTSPREEEAVAPPSHPRPHSQQIGFSGKPVRPVWTLLVPCHYYRKRPRLLALILGLWWRKGTLAEEEEESVSLKVETWLPLKRADIDYQAFQMIF